MTADDPLAVCNKRRRPPTGTYRRHRPAQGGAARLRPQEPRTLEPWDGFMYEATGTAPDLAAARKRMSSIADTG
ncbi:DUF6087 family protein [Streptomyces sp. SID8352]|uniref:DUF6087 family protein n=1 Tax=Streptomyces sp. SID8352 TaxID=2690338 RepID=UPI0031F5FC92